MFIRHEDRQYKIETETDGIKSILKSVIIIVIGATF